MLKRRLTVIVGGWFYQPVCVFLVSKFEEKGTGVLASHTVEVSMQAHTTMDTNQEPKVHFCRELRAQDFEILNAASSRKEAMETVDGKGLHRSIK